MTTPSGGREPLAALLAEKLATARAEWPDFAVSDDAFVAHVARHLPQEEADVRGAIDVLAASDVLLAVACLAGEANALLALDRTMLVPMADETARAHRGVDPAELRQVVRERVLVKKGADPPKLASYAGRASLAAWLRVVAVRVAITMLRRKKPHTSAEDADVQEVLASVVADDVELSHLQTTYAAQMKSAFEEAIGALSDRDRTLLRMHVLDQLSIDDIGRLHRVHRATAARWLVTIRQQLFADTKMRLAKRLGLGDAEFESLVGVLLSRLDVSLSRVLGDTGDPG